MNCTRLIAGLFVAILAFASAPVGGTYSQRSAGGGRSASIEGRILFAEDRPAVGLRVVVMDLPEAAELSDPQGNVVALLGITITDDSGRYSLSDIPPGRYFVATGTLADLTYLAKVTLNPGNRVILGDSRLSEPLRYRVRGRVVRENNMAGESIVLQGDRASLTETPIGSDGAFEFPGVTPGTYRAWVNSAPAASVAFMVVDERNDIEIPLALDQVHSARVKVRVVVDGAGPIPRFKFPLLPDPKIDARPPSALPSRFQIVDVQRAEFDIKLALGPYSVPDVPITLPLGYTVKSIQAGAIDLKHGEVEVTGMGAPPIVVTLAPPARFVQVEGRLTHLEELSSRPDRIRLTHADLVSPLVASVAPDGRFEIPAAAPGSYQAVLEPNPDGLHRNLTLEDGERLFVEMPARPPAMKVRGRIAEFPDGALRSGDVVEITLRRTSPHPGETVSERTAPVSVDGVFDFGVVDAGRYETFFDVCPVPRGEPQPDFFGFNLVLRCAEFSGPVVEGDGGDSILSIAADDLLSTAALGRQITGRVLVDGLDGNGARLSFNLRLQLPADPARECSGPKTREQGIGKKGILVLRGTRQPDVCGSAPVFRRAVEPVGDGTFSFWLNAAEGIRYDIAIDGLPAGAKILSLSQGGTDLLKEPFRVLPGRRGEIVLDVSLAPRP